MRTNAKLTTCTIVGVCVIFTQFDPGMLAQDNPNSSQIVSVDTESSSSVEQVTSTNGRSGDLPASASNVSQASPATQTPVPQVSPADSKNKKPGKSVKKWLLIGAGVAAAITAFLLINKSEPEPQVSVGTPTVGVPQ